MKSKLKIYPQTTNLFVTLPLQNQKYVVPHLKSTMKKKICNNRKKNDLI